MRVWWLLLAGCSVTSERGYYSAFFQPDTVENLRCGEIDGEPTYCYGDDRCVSGPRRLCRTTDECGDGTPPGEGSQMLYDATRPIGDWITPCGSGGWCNGSGDLCHEDECLLTRCLIDD